jgi:Flp pilus assembly protein TadD
VLNNFGALCIIRNRFETARKYLEIAIERIIHVDDCSPIIVGYYCNYAEALFHTGNVEEALKYAEKATKLARNEPDKIRKYAEQFYKDLRRDALKRG